MRLYAVTADDVLCDDTRNPGMLSAGPPGDHAARVEWCLSWDVQPLTTVVVLVDFEHRRLVEVAEKLGYRHAPIGDTGWCTLWTVGGSGGEPARVVHVWLPFLATVLDPLMGAGGDEVGPVWIFPQKTLQRAAWWFRATGHPYHGTLGLSALDVLRNDIRNRTTGRSPALKVERPAANPSARGASWVIPPARDLVWRRPRTGTKGKPKGAHAWDMRAAYLAAAAAADLGWDPPEPTGGNPPEGAPGWYRIVVPDIVRKQWLPIVDREQIRRDGTAWVMAPVIAFLRERGTPAEIVDSYTSANRGRILRPWAERWRDLLDAHTWPEQRYTAPRDVLKLAYVEAIGLLGREGGRIYRPDWHDTIKAQARVSMLRRIARVEERTTFRPALINTDAAYYLCRDDHVVDIRAHIGEGDRIGNMRYEGTVAADGRD